MALLPQPSSRASIVISALSRRETGQPAFALFAAVSKAAASPPGIRAATSRWTLVMVNPASVFSSVTAAVVLISSAFRPASSSCFESAIEKQPACAAAMSSSGFVPAPFSKRVLKEYCVSESTPLSVETEPWPSLKPPRQTAEPFRCMSSPPYIHPNHSCELANMNLRVTLDARATGLVEERAYAPDDEVVRRAVGGDQPVAVENVGRVVEERLAPEVCHATARLREHGFGRARVPLLRLRRDVYVEVALSLDQKSDLDADRMNPHLRADAERAHQRVHARASIRAALGQTHARQLRLVRDAKALGARSFPGLRVRAQDPRAVAARRPVEHVGRGRVEDAERAAARDRETDLHGEVARARDEALRAV